MINLYFQLIKTLRHSFTRRYFSFRSGFSGGLIKRIHYNVLKVLKRIYFYKIWGVGRVREHLLSTADLPTGKFNTNNLGNSENMNIKHII
jgi:hypothetical protein